MWHQSQSQSQPTEGFDLTSSLLPELPIPGATLRNPGDPTLGPFLNACKQADLYTVVMLAKRRRKADGSLNWGLYAALGANRTDVTRFLLHQGVAIDKRAITEAKSPEAFQVLMNYGWRVNDPFEHGNTVLWRVIALQNEALVRWFISQGANPDLGSPPTGAVCYRGNEGDSVQPLPGSGTTLDAAARYSTPAIIDLLISHGANIKNSLPLHNAVTSIWLTSRERIDIMEHVLKLGVDVNQDGHVTGSHFTGGTPLHGAAIWGRLPEVRWLLEHGADVRKGNDFGYAPLIEAGNNRHRAVEELLIAWEISHYGAVAIPASLKRRVLGDPIESEEKPGSTSTKST